MKNAFLLSFLTVFSVSAHPLNKPFHELLAPQGNPVFGYQPHEVAPNLRPLIMAIGLAPFSKKNPTKWCKRIDELLSDSSLPESTYYVEPMRAPLTALHVGRMCDRLHIEQPLLFVAPYGGQSRAITLVRLAGGFQGTIFDAKALIECSVEECRALLAHELAYVARHGREKEKAARYIGPVVLLASALAFGAYKYKQHQLKSAATEQVISWFASVGLVGVTWAVSEMVYACIQSVHNKKAYKLALKAYDHTEKQYLKELGRARKRDVARQIAQYDDYQSSYQYVYGRIESLRPEELSPEVMAFLHQKLREQKKQPEAASE